MATKRVVVVGDTCLPDLDMYAEDDSQVLTSVGVVAASELVGSTKASVTISGATADGDVVYAARFGGTRFHGVRVAHSVGETGAGHEDRPLAVAVADLDVVVTFGTDENGDTVTPTANQVKSLVDSDDDAGALVQASVGGDGSGDASEQSLEPLAGGEDDGGHLKFLGHPNSVVMISTVEDV